MKSENRPDALGDCIEKTLFASPPVVQHASSSGFTVSIAVNQLCTGWVEWGVKPDQVIHTAIAEFGGLVEASDSCLIIPVEFDAPLPAGTPVSYRICAKSLTYRDAYDLSRGHTASTAIRTLRLLRDDRECVRIAVINDTHGSADLEGCLAARCVPA